MTKTITVKAEFKKPKKKKYSKTALTKGTKEEMEHTSDKKVASIIAKEHLDKNPNAYGKAKKKKRKY